MPAKAGIQNYLKTLDSRLRGNDAKGRFKTFYENINIRKQTCLLHIQNSSFIIPNSRIPNSLFLSALLLPYFFVGFLNRFAEHVDVQGFLQVGKSAQFHT